MLPSAQLTFSMSPLNRARPCASGPSRAASPWWSVTITAGLTACPAASCRSMNAACAFHPRPSSKRRDQVRWPLWPVTFGMCLTYVHNWYLPHDITASVTTNVISINIMKSIPGVRELYVLEHMCVTELHNVTDVSSVSFVLPDLRLVSWLPGMQKRKKSNILKRRCQTLVLFFSTVLWMILKRSKWVMHTELKQDSVLWSEYVWYAIIGFFRINYKHQEAVFPCSAELSSVIFSVSAPFPSDSMSHFTSKFSPTGLLKGLIHTYCPTRFSLDKTLPVLWFFKQAWVSKVLEKKKYYIISLSSASITIHPRMSWVAQSSAGLWERFLRLSGLLKHILAGLLNYVWVIFNGSPVCPSLKAAVMESATVLLAFMKKYSDKLTA